MPASNLGAELAIARAAEPELETVLVAAEPEHVQAAELELAPEAVELELVQVAAELGLVQVQAEPERDLVVAVPVRGLVAAEPELAPGVAEPVRGHPRARLAVALRTKSVTAAHRRDLPLLAAEDLVAGAAETTREPAAAEVGTAWEAAATAVVVAVEA